MRRYIDRIRVQETIAAVVLAVFALCVIALFVGCLNYDVPGAVKILYSGLTFPGGAWKVIYEQDDRKHIAIFRTKEEAESAGY